MRCVRNHFVWVNNCIWCGHYVLLVYMGSVPNSEAAVLALRMQKADHLLGC